MRNSFIYLLIVVAIIAIFFTLFSDPLGGSREVPISEVIRMAGSGELESIEVNGDRLNVVSTNGENLTSRKEEGSSIVELLESANIDPLVS
ncbi:MAG: ATP-dependent metallopeptidase FtsH/Yme1/Tma family protein, partial [Dehalococcoidia bacterium]|nr:ATP-dependent metallopeptidase FtsH/Yme1/Tma family protein [Dehalococcoidia bacterium]